MFISAASVLISYLPNLIYFYRKCSNGDIRHLNLNYVSAKSGKSTCTAQALKRGQKAINLRSSPASTSRRENSQASLRSETQSVAVVAFAFEKDQICLILHFGSRTPVEQLCMNDHPKNSMHLWKMCIFLAGGKICLIFSLSRMVSWDVRQSTL